MHEIYRVVKHILEQYGLILFAALCAYLAVVIIVRFLVLLLELISEMSPRERLGGVVALLALYWYFQNPCNYYVDAALFYLPELLLVLYIVITILFLSIWIAGEGLGSKRKHATLLSVEFLRQGLFDASILALLAILPRTLCEGFDTTSLGGYFYASSFTGVSKFLVLLTGAFVLRNSRNYIASSQRHLMEYPLILSLTLLFMLFLVSSNHFIGAFLALIGFSLNLYVLILFDATNSAAREAGIKYYYLSTFSSGLVLYGIFLAYVIAGALEFDSIELFFSTISGISLRNCTLLPAALAFLFTGLFFKLSAFPGHLWAAEVYDGSPEPVTAFFMLPVKIAVLAFVIQLLDRVLSPVLVYCQLLLIVATVGSLIWGCFGALIEKKTKRFLAYASINHIGFILLGLAVGTFASLRATVLYVFIYVITNILFLFFFLNGRRGARSMIYLTDLVVINQNWRYTWIVAASVFSMAGIPPLAGFFSKYYLLLHAQEAGWYGLVIVALATSLVSAYYYLRILKIMWFGPIVTSATPIRIDGSDQPLLLFAEALLWLFGLIVGYALLFCGYW